MRGRSKIDGDVDNTMRRCRWRAGEAIGFTSDITGDVRAREWEELKLAGVKTLSELFVHSGILVTARKNLTSGESGHATKKPVAKMTLRSLSAKFKLKFSPRYSPQSPRIAVDICESA